LPLFLDVDSFARNQSKIESKIIQKLLFYNICKVRPILNFKEIEGLFKELEVGLGDFGDGIGQT